jgi:polysaccharide export outer membrane protein
MKTMKDLFTSSIGIVVTCVSLATTVGAQQAPDSKPATSNGAVPSGVTLPAGYVIGPEDLLSIVFWRDKELSADVVVRPDGKVSLPLLNDVQAAGYTPEQLSEVLVKAATKYIADPSATVIVKAVNSRKVYILGEVAKPGTVPLTGEMNVLQLIAVAGGLLEYADKENITVVRMENGREQRFKFNYKDVIKGKKIEQNIQLKPGDTVLVR